MDMTVTERRTEQVLIRFGGDGNNNPRGPGAAVLRERFGPEVEVTIPPLGDEFIHRVGRSVANPALWVYEFTIEVTYDPDEVTLDPPTRIPVRGKVGA